MDNLKLEILKTINENIDDYVVSVEQLDTDLLDIGLDSILFVRIVVALEEKFQCEIPDSKLIISEINTVNKMAAVIESALDNI